jgi:hypothetical protein
MSVDSLLSLGLVFLGIANLINHARISRLEHK